MLTDIADENNWFSALNPKHLRNGFIHTDDWEFYVHCNPVYPIAYLAASIVLQTHFYSDKDFLKDGHHHLPLGCINDFCEQKREILLKLRTADICHDCMKILKEKEHPLVIHQMLDIFEGVRTRILFNQSFRQNLRPSPLLITKSKKLILTEYNKIEIKLTPLEKAIYFLFLQYPAGLMLHDLPDHKEELRSIYSSLSTSGLLTEIYKRIDDVVNVHSNSASEKISKIKNAFINAIGKDLSKPYIISGGNGEPKKIALETELIIRE